MREYTERNRFLRKKYYNEHKEKELAYHTKWVKENPDKIKKHQNKYRNKNPERKIAAQIRSKTWRVENPLKVKEQMKNNHPRRLNYKGKLIYLKVPPRTGTCSKCKRSVNLGEIKVTNLHHLNYNDQNPLQYTVELCARCHRKEHVKIKNGFKNKDELSQWRAFQL